MINTSKDKIQYNDEMALLKINPRVCSTLNLKTQKVAEWGPIGICSKTEKSCSESQAYLRVSTNKTIHVNRMTLKTVLFVNILERHFKFNILK